jgi:hypothetical protein
MPVMSSEQQASGTGAQQDDASNVLSFHRNFTISIPDDVDLSMVAQDTPVLRLVAYPSEP